MVTDQRSASPYAGLQAYAEEDAAVFFGRDAATHALLAQWLQSRVVIAHGPAGSGKTSLLQAGVLPVLASTDVHVLPIGRVGTTSDDNDDNDEGAGGQPAGVRGFRPTGNPYIEALLRCWSRGAAAPSLLDAIRDHPDHPDRPVSSSRAILAAVDQFEEFFTPRSPHLDPLRVQFAETLAQASAALPNLHLLLVVRSSHRAALAAYEHLLLGAPDRGRSGSGSPRFGPAGPGSGGLRRHGASASGFGTGSFGAGGFVRDGRETDGPGSGGPGDAAGAEEGPPLADVRIGPLDRRAAIAALAEPLRTTRVRFAPGAAAACVDDLMTSRVVDAAGAESVLVSGSVQPVFLQLVATALWRSLPAQAPPITTSRLAAAGGATAVLADHITQVILVTAREHDLDEGDMRAWLTRTFITETGRRGTVDEGLTTTAGMPNALLDALTERYVLRCEQRSGSRRFELFDDRLIEPLQGAFPEWSIAGHAAGDANAADYLHAAQVSFADGDLPTARAHAEEALRRDRGRSLTRAGTETLRAQLYEAQGRLDRAEDCHREAAELYESLADTEAAGRVLAALGRLLLRAGQVGRAAEDLQAAAERLPGDPEVQADLARALWYAGQPWAAAAIFSMVLTIAPDSEAALAGRALLRVELGDDAAALQDLDRLARALPRIAAEPEVRAARALALAHLGHMAEASGESTAALRDAPDSGPVLWRVAEVIRAGGDHRGADDLLRRSLDAAAPPLVPHQQAQVLRLLRRSGAMA